MSRLHVLYIEENEINIHLAKQYLDDTDVDLIVLDDASKSISTIRRLKPDVVMLNIHLKRVDGFFLLRALKINYVTQHIPIIVVCSNYAIATGITTGKFGADTFISEPINRRQLSSAINLFALAQ